METYVSTEKSVEESDTEIERNGISDARLKYSGSNQVTKNTYSPKTVSHYIHVGDAKF